MTAPTKWKLVPVEPPQSLIDEACHEHDPGVMCLAKLNFVERWKRVISAASPAPVVEVSRDSCRDVYAVYEQHNGDDGNRVYSGRRMIAAVQQVLGPHLGMVTREEYDRLRVALRDCARKAEALKQPCGDDPESAQAVRNSQYQAISSAAHLALGTIKGPEMYVTREELARAVEDKWRKDYALTAIIQLAERRADCSDILAIARDARLPEALGESP